MRFSTLTVLSFVPLALTSPVPEPAKPDLIPGVNIANAGIAQANVIPNSYIVVFKDGVSDADIDKFEGDVKKKLGKGPKDKFRFNGFKGYHLQTDAAGLAKVGKSDLIKFVELDAKASVAPNAVNTTQLRGPVAQFLKQQPSATWGLARISHRLKGYFNYIYDSSSCANTRTYVIDTGILTSHQEFGGRAVWGANFIAGSPNTDQNGHGTHCAGTVAGANVGVCKLGTVVAVKVLDINGQGPWSGVISGMQWALNDATNRGMTKRSVISMSLGGSYSAAVNSAVQSIISKGIPVVVAAGNSNANAINFSPASAPGAITVGATDIYDNRASFSNYGASLDVFAPGVSIWSSWVTCKTCYGYLDGTSQATPHVAGVAAYLIAKEGLTSPSAVVNRIVALATNNKVINALGSPNRIVYNGNGA